MYACICTEVCISACTEVDLYVYVCHVLPVQCLSANPRTNMRTDAHPLAGNFAWHLGIATQLRLPPGDGMHYSFVINI